MKKMKVELEHCYGIKKMSYLFDFSKDSSYAIYAANGVMKSSFAKTFDDYSKGQVSSDKMFPTRVNIRKLTDENGVDIAASSPFVIQSYDEVFGHTAKTSTLLINAELRKEYEELHKTINELKDKLLKSIKAQSGTKKDIEKEISLAFTQTENNFYKAIKRIHEEVMEQTEAPFADLKYDVVFDDKVLEFLGTKDFKTAIEEYIKKYNELIGSSTYFKKGIFNYYNASNIAKNLADNGFFKANHTIRLNSGEIVEIKSEKELTDLVAKEKENITNDPSLKSKFSEIEKLLQKNTTVRDFEGYLTNHEDILPNLANLPEFKDLIWKSYLVQNKESFNDLVESHKAAEKRRAEIELLATDERTQWEEVIEEFNQRFFVPFKLIAKNKVSVMLGEEPVLSLGFEFTDGGETASVERGDLLKILSTGEKKALYILNVLFEVAVRQKNNQTTIAVIDDIADSFDYKNKYAIVQYIKDITEHGNFKVIILTHNFDFYRTVESRFVNYKNCLMVVKDLSGINLVQSTGIRNIFVNDWKGNFHSDYNKCIACVPFIRNLIEFTSGVTNADYLKLTSLLHWTNVTSSINMQDLYDVYNRTFQTNLAPANPANLVIDLIISQADICVGAPHGTNFEHKIVLSVGSRLLAEKFIVAEINDPNKTGNITGSQTGVLVSLYKKEFPQKKVEIKVLDKVALMTPENIHLNSFMYEPILDMSDEHLRHLYTEVKALV